jgi:hypothetical protein
VAGSDIVPSRGAVITETHNNTFQITQQPGEDSEALAQRVVSIMERKQQKRVRGAMHD